MYLPMIKKVCKYYEKNRGKKSRSRVQTCKNRSLDFLKSGRVSQKCTSFLGGFVESVLCRQGGEGGQKLPKMCVRLLWTPPYYVCQRIDEPKELFCCCNSINPKKELLLSYVYELVEIHCFDH